MSSTPPIATRPPLREWAEIVVDGRLDAVGPTLDALGEWLRARRVVDQQALDDLTMAINEALTNAIRHGERPGSAVRLAWAWNGRELEVEVSEPGKFEPSDKWSQLPEDPLAEGGRGGFLITSLVDASEHRNEAGRHRLLLRKALRPGQGGGSPMSAPQPVEPEAEAVMGAMAEELGNAYETIAMLMHMSEALATTTDLEDFGRRTFARLGQLTAADVLQVRLLSEGGDALDLLESSQHARGGSRLALTAAGCEAATARDGQERTVARRAGLDASDPLLASAGCAFVCPFSFEGRLRGVVAVARDRDDYFTAGQLGLVRTMADFLGIVCGGADLLAQRQARERARRELEIAAHIQRGLLPERISEHPAWEMHGECVQASEVGGDFYDVIDLPTGGRLVLIADVMGKGVPAALMAATLRTALRAHAVSALDPAALLTKVNRQLFPDLQRLEMFMTAQVLHLDEAGGMVSHASAGHCPILAFDEAGNPSWWEANGLPLGVEEEEVYSGALVRVSKGSRILLMTDGVYEAEDATGRQLEPEELAELARRAWADATTEETCGRMAAGLQVWSAGQPPRDDCTMVAIRARRPANLPT